jgi:urea ABC transporter ATP-binding protein UrtD
MAESILATSSLAKSFAGFRAVDGVDIAISPGEVRGLIGPNGAGKSTLLKLIVGAIEPTAGRITFRGRDITGLPPHARARAGISVKFQITSMFDSLTVYQNLLISVQAAEGTWTLSRFSPDAMVKQKIGETLERVQLAGKRDAPAGWLSHGEKQWLEIGMALISGPELLLLDEPTSGMSRSETNATVGLVRDICSDGRVSALVIEHDIEFIKQVSDRLTVMHHGRVLVEGSVEQVERDETVQSVYLRRMES